MELARSELSSTIVVSVIIPAYNAERSLSVAVDSALAQAVGTEIIVVNDGSVDGTAEVARRYGDRIIYLEQANQGQGAARNRGLQVAKGRYVAFLDSDDYWAPEFLERTVEFLDRHPETVAVLTGWGLIGHDQAITAVPPLMQAASAPTQGYVIKDFFRFWVDQGYVQTGAILVRRSVVAVAGVQRADLRVSQDLEYWALLATYGRWGFVPGMLYFNNSRSNAAAAGWSKRYSTRRRLCPSVEAWESRIVERLSPEDRDAFAIIRGRVAMGFAQNKILGGDPDQARHIVKKFGDAMPKNSLAMVLRNGDRLGGLGWRFACWVIRIKETTKSRGGVQRSPEAR